MADSNLYQRPQTNQSGQGSSQQSMPNNRRPPMQGNTQQNGSRNEQQQGGRRNDQSQDGRRNDQQQGGRRNDQQQDGRRNDQQQGGRRSDQPQDGRRNDLPQDGRQNDQQRGGRRNDQPQDGRRNDQQQDRRRNDQPQYGRRNDQPQDGRRNDQSQDGRRNDQQQGGRRNDQQQDGRRNDQQQGGRRSDQPQDGRRNDQPQDGRQNDQQRGGRRNDQPQDGRRNDQQQDRRRNDQQQDRRRNDQSQDRRRNDQSQDGRRNDQPQDGRRNYQPQDGRRNDQQQDRRRNDQSQDRRRNDQPQDGRRNDQQQDRRRNDQSQDRRRNDQPQDGRRNDQSQDGRRNDQSQDRRRNDQPQDGRRNDQSQDRRRNDQSQDGRRNDQSQDGRRNDQSQDRRRNDQLQDRRRNDQPQDGRRNDQQQDRRRNDQSQDRRRNDQPQDGRRNDQQRGGQNNQQRNEQPQVERIEESRTKQLTGSRQNDEPVQQRPRQDPPTKSPIKEDLVSQPEQNGSKNSCSDLAIPRRADVSKAGTKGRPIMVEANHLALSFPVNLPIAVHYDVNIVPDKPKNLVVMAMEQFKNQYYPNRHPAYDGRKNVYSSSPLPIESGISCEVKVMEDDRERTFTVSVKEVARIDLNLLQQYFKATSNGPKTILPEEAIHCLEVVLRTAASRGCTSVGQSFFTMPRTMMDLGEGMEMYSGMYQSTILGWKPFLNVDVAHKPFPKCQKIIDLIYEFCGDKSTPENLKKVDKFLRTLKVRYEIPGLSSSKRVSRVNQLDKNATEARFKNEEGIEMSVAEYFEKVKNYKLKHPSLPCLWVGNKQKRILYPAELCTLVDNQVTNRTMTPNQTSNMIKLAATSTTVRKNKIMASVAAANYNSDETVREFGIKVNDQFVTIQARVLEPPKLQYAQTAVVPRKGIWRSDKFKNAKSLNRWAILCVDGRVREEQLRKFSDTMIAQGKCVGMKIAQESSIKIVRLSYQRAKDELRRELGNLKDCDLIVVVIPEDKETYGNVKQVAELQVGVLTQCIRSKNIFKLKDTTVANILLKVNAKLNGVNHSLYNTPACLRKPCIIMGADVTHPAPETNGMVPSVAAVTASHDPKAFQYNITWRLQPPTKEIITDLANIVKQHLIFFFSKNRVKPERIIFFRDGVSEGQFKTVLREEVMAIRKACLMLEKEGTYKPAITFIVVQKRHHTRLFPKNPRDSEDRNMNVPAGTVVDTVITHPTDSDFYLTSHASIQGVARPTKYRKLWDDCDMHEDELQELTYHLCHMFSRCNRSVSYPAPTYYAHLAATRAKVYCDGINLSMNDNLEAMQSKLLVKKEVIADLPMFFV